MIRVVVLLACVSGCEYFAGGEDKAKASQASAPSTASSQDLLIPIETRPKQQVDETLPVEADFEDMAHQEITKENLEDKVQSLEQTMSKQSQ